MARSPLAQQKKAEPDSERLGWDDDAPAGNREAFSRIVSRNIARYPILSPAAFQALFTTFTTARDSFERERAAERIVMSYTAFIAQRARKGQTPTISALELLQEGYAGCRHALDRYDPHRPVTFLTYASIWIAQRMQRYKQNTRHTVRLPIQRQFMASAISRTAERFGLIHGRPPSEEEIFSAPPPAGRKPLADRFSESGVRALWKNGLLPHEVSLDAPVRYGDGDSQTLLHTLATPEDSPEDATLRREAREIVTQALEVYAQRFPSPREMDMLRAYYLDDSETTLADIGRQYGFSRERIRQILFRALHRLRRIIQELWPETPRSTKATRRGPMRHPQARVVLPTDLDAPPGGILIYGGEEWLSRAAVRQLLQIDLAGVRRTTWGDNIRTIRCRDVSRRGHPLFYAKRDVLFANSAWQAARARRTARPANDA